MLQRLAADDCRTPAGEIEFLSASFKQGLNETIDGGVSERRVPDAEGVDHVQEAKWIGRKRFWSHRVGRSPGEYGHQIANHQPGGMIRCTKGQVSVADAILPELGRVSQIMQHRAMTQKDA